MAKQKTPSSLHFYRKVKFVIIFLNGYLDPGAVGVVVVVVFLLEGGGGCVDIHYLSRVLGVRLMWGIRGWCGERGSCAMMCMYVNHGKDCNV